jgi:hypothetical protein
VIKGGVYQLAKWQFNKWQVDEMSSQLTDKLVKWQVGKMTIWQNDEAPLKVMIQYCKDDGLYVVLSSHCVSVNGTGVKRESHYGN